MTGAGHHGEARAGDHGRDFAQAVDREERVVGADEHEGRNAQRRDLRRVDPQAALAVATLLVLAFASQRLRMPAADGRVYRKGEAG